MLCEQPIQFADWPRKANGWRADLPTSVARRIPPVLLEVFLKELPFPLL